MHKFGTLGTPVYLSASRARVRPITYKSSKSSKTVFWGIKGVLPGTFDAEVAAARTLTM
jgi:hypothetical protein